MNKGFALIFNIFLIGALLVLGTAAVQIVFSASSSVYLQKDYIKAFYLAEAAIESGKAELHKNPEFYTDMPRSGDLTKWLKDKAKGKSIANGSKVVKELNKSVLYGIGLSGRAYAIIKFENGNFEEL